MEVRQKTMAVNVQDTPWRPHIRLLYSSTLCLTLVLATAIWYGYSELLKLRTDIRDKISKKDVAEFRIWHRPFDDADPPPDWENSVYEQEDFSTKTGGDERHKRHTVEGSGLPEDYVLMNTYSRIPIVAITSYCRDAKEYCSAQGQPGPPGSPGDKGEPGDSGMPGIVGAKGEPGIKGGSPDPKQVAEYLRSYTNLRGNPGQKGDHGTNGEPGKNGLLGPRGPEGPPGPPGIPGRDGTDGESGGEGIPGNDGEKGARGLLGFPGKKGDPGPQGPVGSPGQRGMPGKDGLDGSPGIPGDAGLNGTDGIPGRRGKKGDRGENGRDGERGVGGTPGVPGLKGQKGDRGPKGWRGQTTSCQCRWGRPGRKGALGSTWVRGPQGEKGQSGIMGPMGPMGPKGDRGYTGICPARCNGKTTAVTTTLATTTTTPTPTLPPRLKRLYLQFLSCSLTVIGKPIFKKSSGKNVWGAWLYDTKPVNGKEANVIWVTYNYTGNKIYKFKDERLFRRNTIDNIIDLGITHYFGTGHVVYQGFIYYHMKGENKVVQYDLKRTIIENVQRIPFSAHSDGTFLYSSGNNYYDFAVDENGLWVSFGQLPDGGETMFKVAMLNPDTLEIIKIVNTNVKAGHYGNGFVICGIMYFIKDSFAVVTSIDYAFDIYTENGFAVRNMHFVNPYRKNIMVTYNPSKTLLYGWDNAKQVQYPMRLK